MAARAKESLTVDEGTRDVGVDAVVDNDGDCKGCRMSRNRKEEAVEKAIEMIPDEEKAAYEEAKQSSPDLIAKESDPRRYLRYVKGDVKAAAGRIALYWKRRLNTFGPDRTYLPVLDLSGRGALNDADLVTLRSGITVKLPCDDMGRVVFFNDKARMETPEDPENDGRLRCLFYWFTLAGLCPASQDHGVVLIRVVNRTALDRHRMKEMPSILTKSMPFHVASSHVCCLPQRGAQKTYSDVVVPLNQWAFAGISKNKNSNLHMADTPKK